MPVVTEGTAAPRRSIFKISLGCTLAVVALTLTAIFLCGAPTADAAVCTYTGAPAAPGWTNPANWSTCGGAYAGQNAGDTAVIGCSSASVSAAVPNGVILNMNCASSNVNVIGGGALQLEASSTMGSGGSTITVNGGNLTLNNVGNMTSLGSYGVTLGSGAVNIAGTYTQSNATFTISGGTATNNGTWSVTNGSTVTLNAGGTVINNSTLDVQSGSPANTFTWAGGTLDGTGVTQVGAAPPATLNVTANSIMNGTGTVNSATPNFTLGASINSSSGTPRIINVGTMTVIPAAATIAPEFDNQGTTSLPSTGQTLSLFGGGTHTGSFSFGSGGCAIVFNGAHTFNTPATWDPLTLGATFHVFGGTMTLNVPLTVANFTIDAATVNGGATGLTVTTNASKPTGGTATIQLPLDLGSPAPLSVTTGLLDLQNGGSSSGSITVNGGGTLAFSGGGFLLNSGASLAGPGIFSLTGSGFLDLLTSVAAPPIFQQDGSSVLNVGSANTFTVGSGSSYKWLGGTIFTGTVIAGGTLLIDTTASGVTLDGGSLLNINAPANWIAGTNPLTLKQGSTINLASTLTDQSAGNIDSDVNVGGLSLRRRPLAASPNVINVLFGGAFQKSVNGAACIVSPDLSNNGTVGVTAGTLALAGSGAVIHNGSFNSGPGAILDFSGGVHTFAAATTFGGSGIFELHGATLNLSPANMNVSNFDFASGVLQGTGNVSTIATFVWDGGTMNGPGTMTVGGGTASLSGANGPMILNRALTFAGAVNAVYSGPSSLDINTGSILNNGTFTNSSSANVLSSGGGTFTNNNTYQYNNAASTSFAAPFTNQDVATFTAGTETFTGGYTQSIGTTTLGPGNIGGSAITINGGTLNGNGNITGNVSLGQASGSPANLNPGTSPGSINISGNYTQNATGTLNIDINGTTPATTYDVLNVGGVATLGGTLNTITGYTPANGDAYTPLTYGSHVGTFTTANLTFPGGVYTATYNPTLLQLAAVVQVDLSPAITQPSPSVAAGSSQTYTVTVSNSQTGAASTNQVLLSLTSGTISAATSANGYTCTVTTATTATCTSSTPLGTPQTITVTAIAPAQAGTMTLNATVSTATAFDVTPSNDSASLSTTVNASAGVSIVKTTASPVIAGSTVTYNIVVTNSGPSDALNVAVNDPTPAGLTLVSVVSSFGCASLTPCTIGTLTAGTNTTISATYSIPSSMSGTIVNAATVSTTTAPGPSSPTSTTTDVILQKADLSVTKIGPSTALPGSNVTFKITVTNNGPSDATSVSIDDPTPSRLTLGGVTGSGCSSFPCTLGNMPVGTSKIVSATYTVQPGPSISITNKATASSATTDPNSGNDTGIATVTTGCPSTPSNQTPPDGATGQQVSGILIWSDAGATSYNIYLGPKGSGCTATTPFATSKAPAVLYSNLQGGTTYEWRVEAVSSGCAIRSSSCTTFTTVSTCPSTPPTLTSPVNTTVNGQTTFVWSDVGAVDYKLFVNGGLITTTTSTSFGPTSVSNGQTKWYVVAEFAAPCGPLQSATATYNACDTSAAKTIPSIIAQADALQTYTLSWDIVSGASRYAVDEAKDVNFNSFTTLQTTDTHLDFQHPVTTPTAFFYRVRAFIDCANAFGPNSTTVRVVLSPATAPSNPNVSAPAGSRTLVPILVHIPGFPDGTFPFTATLDAQQPWLKRVEPAAGVLPPEGIDLTVFADPTGLTNGTHTGTVIVLVNTTGASGGSIVANGVTPVGAPVSVSLVTPVTPKASGPPPANALIIPSTGHLDGLNSRWASDVRILNTSSQTVHYLITFTPDDATQGVKQTTIQADAGATIALDDVIKVWYGVGSLGESSNGSLEIRPLDNPAKTGVSDAPNISFTTVASSRTYNAAANSSAGTLGEFIPAIPFASFVGKALQGASATVLGLQQIAQSDSMRTNFGVMEASGNPVSILVDVFDSSGKKLLEKPMTLLGGQHAQFNGFLAQNKLALNDGRITVQVTSGDGKITTYASVIDNKSGDPILVSGVPLGQQSFDHFVLPGVADLNTPNAAWRTDARIFNPTSTAQNVTLTFIPMNNSGAPQTKTMTINPGEVKVLDNTLQSVFGLTNTGGAIHVTTASPAPLVISGRTYNLTANGTYGQLTTAVTSADAIGVGDRPMQILQTEDSVRERTNVGVFEVTGKPATVEVSLFLPDSKTVPSTQIPLPANGYIQIPAIQSFGLTNVYNARVSLKVVGGDGKISAYGSVIDQLTQDPTLIPGQK